MKKNLIYIVTLITIVVALNYMHIHSDPYPDCHDTQEPFFACWLRESHDMHKLSITQHDYQEPAEQEQPEHDLQEYRS